MASKVPAFQKPLTATSGCFFNACQPEIIQLALGLLMTCNPTSTLTWKSGIVSGFFTSWKYHCWNLLLRWSFIGLFIKISKGCNLTVQFAGNWIGTILWLLKSDKITSIVQPWKLSKMAATGNVESSFNFRHFSLTKGTITLSMYRFIVILLDQ